MQAVPDILNILKRLVGCHPALSDSFAAHQPPILEHDMADTVLGCENLRELIVCHVPLSAAGVTSLRRLSCI